MARQRCQDCGCKLKPMEEDYCDNCAEKRWVAYYSDLDRSSAKERDEKAWRQKQELDR